MNETVTSKDQPRRRVLIFTDSRGQHKPAGQTHDVFAERLAKDPRLDVTSYLCPMKWTTTLDFLEQFSREQLAEFDHVVLYTGIVDWSPRPLSNAYKDLYCNENTLNAEYLALNTRDYSKKVINYKKSIFDAVIGADVMERHFAHPFKDEYEGEATINMYPLAEGVERVASILAGIPNLIFINSNRFVPGWEGDYKKTRPSNIRVSEAYSEAFRDKIPANRLVNLLQWSAGDVRRYTCDNLHLSQAGSDWIYKELMDKMDLTAVKASNTVQIDWEKRSFEPFKGIERLDRSKIDTLAARVGREGKSLATLIIGVRLDPAQPERAANLIFLLDWIDHYYADAFDVLLVEQDTETRIDLTALNAKPYVRHEFIYNHQDYNRGWAYNVAARHFCDDAVVIALMDTDVLTGPKFVSDILSCYKKYDICSPYMNVYYTDAKEAAEVFKTRSLTKLADPAKIKNPVTLSGGVVIFNKTAYMALKGFEQYIGYSCEDRALDTTLLNHLPKERIRVTPETYVHLHHDTDKAARKNFDQIFSHLKQNYACFYDPTLSPYDFIHTNCNHACKEDTTRLMLERSKDFGSLDLYSSWDPLTVNGQRVRETPVYDEADGVIFPPTFKDLDGYPSRELYAGLPTHDAEELSAFYNMFQGERCFIIGNGPSLNKNDLALLENEYSFGVNSFYYKTRETGFRPTFYVVEDNSVMKENLAEIKEFEAPFKFFPTLYKRLHPKTPNTFFFEMNRGFYEKSSLNYVVPRFSTDASKVLYCGQSVTYINLQLAFYMGFTEVYLIGMDFNYDIPASHKRTGDVLLSDSDDPNHFHKDYFGAGKTWKDPKLERVLVNYKMADLAFTSVGRKIYNSTVGGKLEVFDRVDFETLLRDPVSGTARKERMNPEQIAVQRPGTSAPVQPAAPQVATQDAGQAVLRTTASALLLEPEAALARIASGGDLERSVQAALARLAPDDDARMHFEKVRSFAQRKMEVDA